MLRQSGFSLIELVVILLVMAVVSSGVMIAVGTASSDVKQLENIGKQLWSKMRFASDEALIQQRLIGLRLSFNGSETSVSKTTQYDWVAYQGQRWEPLSDTLAPASLADNIQVDISVDDVLLDTLLERSLNDELGSVSSLPPAVIFYPNSDISDFVLTLSLSADTTSSAEQTEHIFRIFKDQRGQLTHSGLSDFPPNK